MGPILLCTGHRGVSAPLRLLRYTRRPMVLAVSGIFELFAQWLALADDRADSVLCEDASSDLGQLTHLQMCHVKYRNFWRNPPPPFTPNVRVHRSS